MNAGRTWTPQTYSTAQLYHVTTTKHQPYHACGAQQDNTTVCVPSNGRGASYYPVAAERAATSRPIRTIPKCFMPEAMADLSRGSTMLPINDASSTSGRSIRWGNPLKI